MSKEREKIILEMLLKKKRLTVKELSSTLYISEPSVRRDLSDLEKQNLIKFLLLSVNMSRATPKR